MSCSAFIPEAMLVTRRFFIGIIFEVVGGYPPSPTRFRTLRSGCFDADLQFEVPQDLGSVSEGREIQLVIVGDLEGSAERTRGAAGSSARRP